MQLPVDMRILITCFVLAVIGISPCTGYSLCQETASDGTVIYEACESAANPFIHTSASTGNGMVNITLEPEDATCGLSGAEVYCTLAVIQCYQCNNAVPELAHPLANTYDLNDLNGQNFNTFWQSKSMEQMFIEQGSQGTPTLEVNITFSLGHLFTLQDNMVVKFKSSRPRSMVFEKSSDYGVTWEPWQYFEYSCSELWQDPNIYTMDSITTDTITNVICTQEYREQSPYTGGDVIFDLTERRDLYPTEEDLYNNGYAGTPNLKEFYSFTDIRIRLLQPATSGFAQTGTRLNQYYYAISDILIPAGCFCNLHGNYCELDAESNLICNCAHNTMGATCESCLPLFNNQPWAPGRYDPYPTGTPNACQECECHSHAESCTYIEELDRGRCDICLHNTMGDDCGSCMPNYYKNESVTWHDLNACADCNCQPFGVDNGDMTCTDNVGQCNCKMLVTGTKCDRCQDNYYGLLSGTAGSCQPCNCNAFGLISGTQTDPCNYDTGQCICKPRIEGRTCDTCRAGSYLFPHIYNADCTDCGCDPGGSTTFVCDTMSGACECKPGISRRACDLAINGYFVPGIDEHSSQPVANAACTFETSIIIPSQTMYFTDIGYFSCPQEQTLTMEPIDGSTWKSVLRAEYLAVLRYSIESTEIPWAFLTIQVAATGDSNVNMDQYNTDDDDTPIASTCPDRDTTQTFDITSLPVGVGLATITLQQNLTIDARCTYGVNLVIGTSGGLPSTILIDSIAYFPNYLYSARYLEANEATRTLYDTCVQQLAALGSRAAAAGRTECQEIIFSIGSQWHDGAIQCECNTQGTLPGTDCARLGGQCSCKQGVFGRQCDQCEPGYYNFTERGCDPCECSSSGSRLLVCDYETGQCPCLENVALNGVLTTVNTTDNRQCEYCIENYYGHHTGQGCQACNCQETGVTSMQCDDDGVCPCRDLVSGQLCDTCVDGYYGLASIGCSACNCSVAGSLSITCDQANGNCDCKPNVNGEKCDLCDANTFNLREDNPDGCQWCFCYGHSTACTSAPGYQSATVTAADTSVWESVTDESAGTYYKRAPAEFLGNKLTSYGQHLTLTFVPRTQVTVEINNYFPIKLTGNGGQEISYNLSSVTITTSGYQLTAMLHETYWSFDDTTTPTPLEMSAILTSLEMLCVQQRYGDVTFSITDVTLMTTAPVTELAEPEVGFVEVCTCEDNTRGVNCEFCDNGYQRENVDSLNRYENCRACDCRGRAIEGLEICNESTGECLNCRDGTVGFSCESCSANVNVASDCTTCETGFWGISQEGCAACECHPEGAQSTVCDGVTGMCTCQDFVGGRQCDQCVDNYELLTATGCTECDECYALVGVAVDELRVMRDNITMYVEELRANNSNIALGSFSVRLQSTLDNLDLLLGFLADFSTLHETVGPQMVELNATLLSLREVLTVSVEVNIFTTNETLLRADGVAMQAQSVYEQTVATTIAAYTIKTGSTVEPCPISEEHCTLHDMVTLMDELVLELSTLQSDIAELSTGAMAEATQIMGYVRDVEDAATQATAITTESQQIMGDTIAVHENNTVRLTALELYLETVTATETVVVSAAEESRQNATASLQRAVDTLSNATELVATPEENVQSQLTRAVGLIENAESQATQAGNSYNVTEAAYQTAVTEVVDTNLGLQTAVAELENATVVIEGRAAEAEAMADQARANATDIFIAAQNMVDVLRNFNTRTTEIRAQVTTSLATVEQIRTESLAATATATNIVTELTPSASISDNALEIANETNINAGQQNEDIVAAQTRSNILTATSGGLVTSISEDLAVVEERNDTSVTAAAQSCRALNSNVGILESLTTTSQQRVEEANVRTRTTNNELTRLLGELSLIMQLDPVAIEELRGRIQAAQEDLNERQLQAIAQELQRASVAQRTRINEMQAQKVLLESKIQHLRTLQGQLRVG